MKYAENYVAPDNDPVAKTLPWARAVYDYDSSWTGARERIRFEREYNEAVVTLEQMRSILPPAWIETLNGLRAAGWAPAAMSVWRVDTVARIDGDEDAQLAHEYQIRAIPFYREDDVASGMTLKPSFNAAGWDGTFADYLVRCRLDVASMTHATAIPMGTGQITRARELASDLYQLASGLAEGIAGIDPEALEYLVNVETRKGKGGRLGHMVQQRRFFASDLKSRRAPSVRTNVEGEERGQSGRSWWYNLGTRQIKLVKGDTVVVNGDQYTLKSEDGEWATFEGAGKYARYVAIRCPVADWARLKEKEVELA